MPLKGCGKGHDVIMLALHGFDAWGLEISETAVSTAERYASEQMQSPSPENFARVEVGRSIEPGSVRFIQGDFFKQDWEMKLLGEAVKFDLIYDYTVRAPFFCASKLKLTIPVSLRFASQYEVFVG